MSFNHFEHNQIQLKDITSATNDFNNEPIGNGGFGKVYRGELSCPDGQRRMVAFKRLGPNSLHGRKEFWNEVMMLYQLTHENLVSLLYHCIDCNENILVYEYASRGSLDRYLGDTSLAWCRRLKICLGAARGLNYLHDPNKEQKSIIHRDVKSANILLDENWTAKISDLGLSKFGSTKHTCVISNPAGTYGYLDPLSLSCLISKESDVYSFGVVLFEVMFGKLCYEYCNGRVTHFFLETWKQGLAEKRLDDIICIDHIDMDSLQTFSRIANQCLNMNRKERPTMADIIKELEIALDQQEMSVDVEERTRFLERLGIAKQAVTPPASCTSRIELTQLLSEGIILKGKKKISLNKNQHYREMIPAEYWIGESINEDNYSKRYDNCKAFSIDSEHQFIARTEFLSTDHVTYTINLVYKYGNDSKGLRVPLRYKLEEETNYWTCCVAERKEGGLLSTELFQFTSNQKEHCFNIKLLSETRYGYQTDRYDHKFMLEGIEFCPVEHDKDENLEDESKVDVQPIIDINHDFAHVIRWSPYKHQRKTNKELYNILREGFLINNGKQWISINKKMKKRCFLPAEAVLYRDNVWWRVLSGEKSWIWKTISESRFKVAEFSEINRFDILFKIDKRLLSHGTAYACYLVYKLPKEHSFLKGMVHLQRHISSDQTKQLFYLTTAPHTPIIGHMVDETNIPVKTRKIKGHPKLRKDGWMEIQMWDFYNDANGEDYIKDRYHLNSYNNWNFTGLLVQGIEFRPAKVCFSPLC